MMHPDFSIIMPTYNRAFCITNAIDSILIQEYKNWELIIIDDGSTDETEELIRKKYQDYLESGQIQYIKSDHVGVSKARNIGLEKAKYDWIGYLDTDNTLCSNYFEVFVQAIQQNETTKIFYAQSQSENRITGQDFDRQALEKSNFIDLGAFIHKKELFTQFGGFNENLKRLVDWDLILKYTKENVPVFIPKVVLNYDNSNQISRITNTESLEENKKVIQKTHHIKHSKGNTMLLLKIAKSLHIISSKKYKELRAVKAFKKSKLFDTEWYLASYPDVAKSTMSPEKHYYKYGWKEGRNPSPLFNGNAYLDENQDVKDAGRNPLEHYLVSGQYEGRYYSGVTKNNTASPVYNDSLWGKIKYALAYPVRLQEECDHVKFEIEELEKKLKK